MGISAIHTCTTAPTSVFFNLASAMAATTSLTYRERLRVCISAQSFSLVSSPTLVTFLMKAVFFLRFESKVLKNALPADGYEDQYVLNFPAGTWILGIKIGLTKNKQVFSRFLCFLRSCLSLGFSCELCLQEIRLIASKRQWVMANLLHAFLLEFSLLFLAPLPFFLFTYFSFSIFYLFLLPFLFFCLLFDFSLLGSLFLAQFLLQEIIFLFLPFQGSINIIFSISTSAPSS